MNYWFFIWKEVKTPILLLISTLVGGACGYKVLFPDESWLKIIYATAITLSTVGYGDILGVEQNPVAAIYTIILIFLGMGLVLYSASMITAYIIEGHLREIFIKQSNLKRAKAMENHFIICGAGGTGYHVLKEVIDSGKEVVIVEASEDRFHVLRKEFPKLTVLVGDATSDELLEKANIKNAHCLVATLNNDKDNLFLTFTARMMNPDLKIVAKVVSVAMTPKLKGAGADYVVSPYFIGGMRMASVALRPNVVSFLDRMLRGKDRSMRVGEFVIPRGSSLVGKTIKEAQIYQQTGINIVAYSPKHNSEEFLYNPPPETQLQQNGVLLFVCNPEQQKSLEVSFS